LAVLELYFRAQAHSSPRLKMATALVIVVLTGLTALGIFGAYNMM